METEFEQRLLEILAEYPEIDPGRAALALKGQPEATNKQIALLSKARPEEAHQVARGKVDRPSKLTATPPDLARVLEEEYAKKYPNLPLPARPAPAAPVEPVEPGPEDLGPTSTGPTSQGWKDARKVAEWLQERDPGSPAGRRYLASNQRKPLPNPGEVVPEVPNTPDQPVTTSGDAITTAAKEIPKAPPPGVTLPTVEKLAGMTDAEVEAYIAELDAAGVDPTSYSLKEAPTTAQLKD